MKMICGLLNFDYEKINILESYIEKNKLRNILNIWKNKDLDKQQQENFKVLFFNNADLQLFVNLILEFCSAHCTNVLCSVVVLPNVILYSNPIFGITIVFASNTVLLGGTEMYLTLDLSSFINESISALLLV